MPRCPNGSRRYGGACVLKSELPGPSGLFTTMNENMRNRLLARGVPASYFDVVDAGQLLKFDHIDWGLGLPPSHARETSSFRTPTRENPDAFRARALHKKDWDAAVPGMKAGDLVKFGRRKVYTAVIKKPTVRGFFDAISRVIKSYCAAEDIDPKHPDLWFEGHVERHVDGGRVYWSFDHGT